MLEVYSIATVQKQSVTCNILTVRSTVDYPQIKYQNLLMCTPWAHKTHWRKLEGSSWITPHFNAVAQI